MDGLIIQITRSLIKLHHTEKLITQKLDYSDSFIIQITTPVKELECTDKLITQRT